MTEVIEYWKRIQTECVVVSIFYTAKGLMLAYTPLKYLAIIYLKIAFLYSIAAVSISKALNDLEKK